MNHTEAITAILAARKKKKITWEQLAAGIGMSPVWTTSACLGQNSMPAPLAARTARMLGLPAAVAATLSECPMKGSDKTVPTDPLIYRFHEITQVYGTAIKELVHEKFGDGIMSAIDFTLRVDKVEDAKGDRVQVTMSGKFLPYKKW